MPVRKALLNCLLTTPGMLVAFAQHDPPQAPEDQPVEVYDLRWRVDHDRVLISSTGCPQEGFATLAQGAALTVHRGTLRVEEHPPLPTAPAPGRRSGALG